MATESQNCPKCGTRIHVDETCPRCAIKPFARPSGSADSLVAAIEGNLNGMAHSDLVLTCQMLERGRATWRKEAEALHATLVMLKRELDPHISDATKYELPRSAWEEVVRRHGDNPPNAGTQRPGSPDGWLATETRKPGSLK